MPTANGSSQAQLDKQAEFDVMSPMDRPLLAPEELAPPDVAHLSVEQRVALWAELMDACEQFLLAGLRRQVGPHGDLAAAYRAWHEAAMAEHDRVMQHMMDEIARRSPRDAG